MDMSLLGSSSPVMPAVVAVPRHLLCRTLYANPVCLLCTSSSGSGSANDGAGAARNVMTISWLTPLNSCDRIILCVKASRHSAANLRSAPESASRYFTLNVATWSMRSLLRKTGSCSGRDTDKISSLGVNICAPGWKDDDHGEVFAVSDAICHIVCVADEITERDGHLVIFATIERAFAREAYWDGRNLIGRPGFGTEGDEIMTFLGSGKFAKMMLAAADDQDQEEKEDDQGGRRRDWRARKNTAKESSRIDLDRTI